MNNVTLVGRLTRDPELRTVGTGNTTSSFSVAVDRAFTNANGQREADFINCVIWGKQAENLCKYCKKGSLIGIVGRVQTRNYDGTDGKKVYVTEIYVNNVTFLGSKNSNNNESYTLDNSANNVSSGTSSNTVETSDVSEDPFKDFGSEVVLNDEDLPF